MKRLLQRLKKLISDRSPLRLGWHKGKSVIAAGKAGFPAGKLTVIGITGTDGKTTTVNMVAHILQSAGHPTGALSTAAFRIKDKVTWNATQKTSPSPSVIQNFLKRIAREGCTHAVLEYSSHGLVQGRLDWTQPSIAGITNTSPEHLDYHKTMEQYRKDKGILFRMLRGRGTKVLNARDGTFEMYRPLPSSQTIVYSTTELKQEETDDRQTTFLWLTDVSATPLSTAATLHYSFKSSQPTTYNLQLSIPGSFNLENALCAIGCAFAAGVEIEKAINALASFRGVPGRMERIEGSAPFSVFVDFTVTPVSYTKTLTAMKGILQPGGRLLVLTGSCGDRMKEKRPEVGRITSELADLVVVSNEDPYTEDPEKIIDDVLSGVDPSKKHVHRIVDRGEAIRFLFQSAQPGDIILLCGKGSDSTMWVGNEQVPWNEREIAKEMLKEYSH